ILHNGPGRSSPAAVLAGGAPPSGGTLRHALLEPGPVIGSVFVPINEAVAVGVPRRPLGAQRFGHLVEAQQSVALAVQAVEARARKGIGIVPLHSSVLPSR